MHLGVQVGVLVTLGVLLIVGSVAFHLCFNNIFNVMLDKKLQLVPGSQTLENFKSPPVPIFMQYWFFNVTNSEAVLEGAKPALHQVGPYTFAEKQLKYDLTFDDEEGSVTYLQNKSFYFRPDLSPGHSLSDMVTTINAVMMSTGAKMDSGDDPLREAMVELWFTRFAMQPFVTHPVRELLFEGYEEPFLKQIYKLSKDPVHATGKFGFFYLKNNTHGGAYTVYTGVKGMDNYQHILRWRGDDYIHFWKKDMWGGNTCNMINGTTGNQYPRPVGKHEPLVLFTAELCRSIYAEYQQDVQHGALTLHRFVLPAKLMADVPENKCYCVNNFTCRASMIDVSPCRNGAPVVMSTPHFYQGEPADVALVDGLNPNAREHETYLDIEPTTGVVFRAAKRIQINMVLRRYANLPAFRKVPDVILPVLWVNESVEVPLERTYALDRTLTRPFTIVDIVLGVLVTLGATCLIVALIKFILAHKRKTQQPKAKNRKGKGKEKELSVTEKLNSRNYS